MRFKHMAPQSKDAVENGSGKTAPPPVDTVHLLDLKPVPDSWSGKTETWLKDGVENYLPGVWNSAKEDFTTAAGWKRVGWNFGTSLVLGGLLKAALPEGGIATKVAGAGLGLVFGGMA